MNTPKIHGLDAALTYFEKSLDLGVPNKPKHATAIIQAARAYAALEIDTVMGHLERAKILTGDAYLGTDMNKECDQAYSEICKALKLLEGTK